DLLQSLYEPSYQDPHEGSRDSNFKSQSDDGNDELLPLPGEENHIEDFDGAGQSFRKAEKDLDSAELLATPWHPFWNVIEFKLTYFFLQSGTSQQSIEGFLKGSLI